jgi:hypothetical protein
VDGVLCFANNVIARLNGGLFGIGIEGDA